MVEAARELAERREILKSITTYVRTVNTFFRGKRLRVIADGSMVLASEGK
jgi:hypothetical protein